MFGSQILEIVIGMMLIYLLFSLLLTAVREVIEAWLKTRAVDLEKCLAEMLGDDDGKGDRAQLFNHNVIFSLFAGDYQPTTFVPKPDGAKAALADAKDATVPTNPWRPCTTRTPSYIPRELFADAMIDLYRGGRLTTAAATLNALYRSAGGDPAVWRTKIMAWYDAAMDRATGWYRRRTQGLLLGLGFGLALFMNVNSATLIGHLASNDALRQQLVAQAEAEVKNAGPTRPAACNAAPSTACVTALNARVQGLGLPIGWSAEGRQPWVEALELTQSGDLLAGIGQFLMLICGMFATALAVSLGAPFWFDMLSKVMNVRSTLKPPADAAAPAAVTPAAAPSAALPAVGAMREHDHEHDEPASPQPLVFG